MSKNISKWYGQTFVSKMTDETKVVVDATLGGKWWRGAVWGQHGSKLVVTLHDEQGLSISNAHIDMVDGAVKFESLL